LERQTARGALRPTDLVVQPLAGSVSDDEASAQSFESDDTSQSERQRREWEDNTRALEEDAAEARREMQRARDEAAEARRKMNELEARLEAFMRATEDKQKEQVPLAAAVDGAPRLGREDARQMSSGSGAQPAPRQGQRARVRFKHPPPALTYEKASDARTLDEWMYQMGKYFIMAGVEEDDEASKMTAALLAIDYQLDLWWRAVDEKRAREGRAVTWEGMKRELRRQFVSESTGERAYTELLNVRQKAGESLDAYFRRADELRRLANNTIEETTLVAILVERIHSQEWPYARNAAMRARKEGKIESLAGLRALLLEEETHGQDKMRRALQPQAQPKMSGAPWKQNKTTRAAAVAATSAPEDQEEGQHTAAVRSKSNVCFRCRGEGHFAAQCKAPDARTCNLCGEKGHIVASCPKLPGARKAIGKNE